jgi:hypothetical protein
MSPRPILLIGGSGVVGRWAARFLRDAHPETPILIGGRDRAKAEEDLAADDLAIGDRPVGAVAVFPNDDTIAGLRFAQARGVPHISISGGVNDMSPEVAAYMHRPHAAPVVLGVEWLVGAVTVPTLEFAKALGRVHDITIGDGQCSASPGRDGAGRDDAARSHPTR